MANGGNVYGPPCYYTNLGNLAPMQEFGSSIPSTISLDNLPDFHGIIGQEIVKDQLSDVTKHLSGVIPDAEESEDLPVVLQELRGEE